MSVLLWVLLGMVLGPVVLVVAIAARLGALRLLLTSPVWIWGFISGREFH